MSDYDNRGQVALWRPKSDNPQAPQARGTITAHRDIREGEEVEIALWRNRSDNPNAPVMKGKISDKYNPHGRGQSPPQGSKQAQSGPVEDPDDSIPF